MAYDPQAWGAKCTVCPLAGKRVVAPTGPLDAELVIVGEGPGYLEEIRGTSFCGPSGDELNRLLREAGGNRARTFVTNALACRAEVPGEQGTKRYEVKAYVAWLAKENKVRKKNRLPPLQSPFDCCLPRLMKELDVLLQNATATGRNLSVSPVGNFAKRAVLGGQGKADGIMRWRGSVLTAENTPEIAQLYGGGGQ